MPTTNDSSLSTKAVVNFADALERNENISRDVFSQDLITLLQKHFGFEYVTITMLNNGLFYNSGNLFNSNTDTKMGILRREYRNNFHQYDRLSQYLHENQDFLARKGRYTIRAAEATEIRQFIQTDYRQFLNRSGFGDIIVMDFQIKNRTYRINFFKELDGGDFTEKDVDFLSDVQRLIKLKIEKTQHRRTVHINDKMKGAFLDGLGTGYLLFDTQGNLMEYNQRAMIYTASLFPKKNLADMFIDLTGLMTEAVRQGETVMVQHYKGYKIHMMATPIADSSGDVEMYYFFLLTKQNELIVSDNKLSFSEILSKRELEVLDEYCQGKDLKAIANDLFISESTVRQHIKNIYQKLKINNQRALVRLYMHDKLGSV